MNIAILILCMCGFMTGLFLSLIIMALTENSKEGEEEWKSSESKK